MSSDFLEGPAQLCDGGHVDDYQSTWLHCCCNFIDALPRGKHVKYDAIGARGFAVFGEHFLQVANDNLPVRRLGSQEIFDIPLGNFCELGSTLKGR